MKKIKLGAVGVDAAEYASQGNAILGIRDSGKSYTATCIAEQLFGAGIPFTAFDPIGIWKYLRVPGRGSGYPVVVAGGRDGDLPLTVASAPEIVRAAMRNGISIVLDLYSMDLSKADWKRIVAQSVNIMLHENGEHGLRHIFIEEAAEFAPQRIGPDQGHVYAAVEKLARMGGNALLGYTLINQRAEEVNKAVLELCDSLFLHRQKGRNSLVALSKWLDIADARGGRDIIRSLPQLEQGKCWVWSAGTEAPVLTKIPAKNSFHPDRRALRGGAKAAPGKQVDVQKFVSQMADSLKVIEAEISENDPKRLRAELAATKKRLTEVERLHAQSTGAQQAATAPLLIEQAFTNGRRQGAQEVRAQHVNQIEKIHSSISSAMQVLDSARNSLCSITDFIVGLRNAPESILRAGTDGHTAREISIEANRRRIEQRVLRSTTGSSKLPPGEKAVLIACAQHGECTREQLSILTGYKRSSRDAYIQRLREKGFVTPSGNSVHVTDAGVSELGSDYEPLPTGVALQDYWIGRLPPGERAVLEILIKAYPNTIQREEIDAKSGYKRSSRDAYIQRLKARQLVRVSGAAGICASDALF